MVRAAVVVAWAESAELQPWNESALAFYGTILSRERPKEAMERAHEECERVETDE